MYASSSKRGKCVSTQKNSPINCTGLLTEIRGRVLVPRTQKAKEQIRVECCMQLTVRTFTMHYALRAKQFCAMQTFPSLPIQIVFTFCMNFKQRSSDVTVQHQWLVDSEVLLGSTRFKGKAEIQARVSQLFQKTTPSSNGHPNTSERILRNYNKHKTY